MYLMREASRAACDMCRVTPTQDVLVKHRVGDAPGVTVFHIVTYADNHRAQVIERWVLEITACVRIDIKVNSPIPFRPPSTSPPPLPPPGCRRRSIIRLFRPQGTRCSCRCNHRLSLPSGRALRHSLLPCPCQGHNHRGHGHPPPPPSAQHLRYLTLLSRRRLCCRSTPASACSSSTFSAALSSAWSKA